MNADITKRYHAARAEGYNAQHALYNAVTLAQFENLESIGLVRFRWMPDESSCIEDLEGDCFDPASNPGVRACDLERRQKEFHETVDRDGVWGLVGQYRPLPFQHGEGDIVLYYSEDDQPGWETGDSIWGLVGQDAHMYTADIASQTIVRLVEALKDRCGSCRKVNTQTP